MIHASHFLLLTLQRKGKLVESLFQNWPIVNFKEIGTKIEINVENSHQDSCNRQNKSRPLTANYGFQNLLKATANNLRTHKCNVPILNGFQIIDHRNMFIKTLQVQLIPVI